MVKRYNKDNSELMIKQRIVADLDKYFADVLDNEFADFINPNNNVTEKQEQELESIFMAFRNVIAGTEWAGEKQEYETYSIRGI